MKRPESRTAANRSLSSSTRGAYCAFEFMRGIGCVTRASLASARLRSGSSGARGVLGDTSLAPLEIPPAEPRCAAYENGRDDVLDVAERVMEVLPRLTR